MSIQDEIKTQNAISDIYVKRYNTPHAFEFQKYLGKKIVKLVEPKGRILDNGCGPGYFCKNFLSDLDIIGVDISEKMLTHAKRNLKDAILGDSQNLPFKNEEFDIIFARSLLHHLPDPQKGADEMHRVLKPGGKILTIDPIVSLTSYAPRKLLNKTKHFSSEHKNMRMKELKEMLHKSGFKITKIEYCNYIGYAMVSAPDIFNPLKFLPFKSHVARMLLGIDEIMSKVPFFNKWLALGVIIVCEKPKN